MTSDQETFCTEIVLEYVRQVELERDKAFVSKEEMVLRRYLLILKRIYAVILTDYFYVFHTSDANFFTEDEMQIVLDRFNYLCGTEYTVDFTISDYTNAVPVYWDDTLIWDDDDFWTE